MTRQQQLNTVRRLLDGEYTGPFDVQGFTDARLRTLWAVASSFVEVNATPSRQRLITVWYRVTGENEHQLDHLLDEVNAA